MCTVIRNVKTKKRITITKVDVEWLNVIWLMVCMIAMLIIGSMRLEIFTVAGAVAMVALFAYGIYLQFSSKDYEVDAEEV